jgi:hypothetical protein
MKIAHISLTLAAVAISCHIASGQGFVNLDFEDTTITPVLINSFSGYYDYIATVPGWTWTPQNNAAAIDADTMVSLNTIALDAPAVTLHSVDDPYGRQAIQGNYSILLQGGSPFVSSTSYSSIGQTGQIPSNAKSIVYWGGALQATFNGQPLSLFDISDNPNYTIWSADISAYAGQSGQLLFTAPWQTTAFLDNIQFSSSPVPEPSILSLICLSFFLLSGVKHGLIPRQAASL